MQITANTTPCPAEISASTDKHGRKRCVIVVKATFDVDDDGECRLAQVQTPLVYKDEHYGDPGSTSIRHEADFSPVKPRADVLVHASAMAPGLRPVTRLEVALAGPGIFKQAVVTGDREWVWGVTGVQPSAPQPFMTLPLCWDRAFGGVDTSHEQASRHGSEVRNLVGVGFRLNSDPHTMVGLPLPNIENPKDAMRGWADKPEPVGFAPLGRGWQPRIGFAGTYDQKWKDEKLPFLPDDFDDRYFQSAPLDQQLQKLSAGMAFGCSNMNGTGRFIARLPAWTVPLRFVFEDRVESQLLQPDTLILEPGAGRIVLVGRAAVALPRKITTLREIQVGPRKSMANTSKPRFGSLGEAVAALRGRRKHHG